MTKYLLIVLALAAAAAGAFGRIEQLKAKDAADKAAQAEEHVRIAEQARDAAQHQLSVLQATNLQRQQELNDLRTKAEAQQKALNAALQANPDWASTPVPGSVWDALLPAASGPAAGKAGPGVVGADAKAAAAGPR